MKYWRGREMLEIKNETIFNFFSTQCYASPQVQQQQVQQQQHAHQQTQNHQSQPNGTPARQPNASRMESLPEIRKYKTNFQSNINCASLWGVNLLVGCQDGLKFLDRSGQGEVYTLHANRPFKQIDVLEQLNVAITVSGKKDKLRCYYLSNLRSKNY